MCILSDPLGRVSQARTSAACPLGVRGGDSALGSACWKQGWDDPEDRRSNTGNLTVDVDMSLTISEGYDCVNE